MKSKRNSKNNNLYTKFQQKFIACIAIVIFCFSALFYLFLNISNVPSTSMAPTIQPNDIMISLKLAPFSHTDLSHEDIVLFYDDNKNLLVKRVIGLSGDTVEINNGVVKVNGTVEDPAKYCNNALTEGSINHTVPDGKIFLLGDNRTDSKDSRIFGDIDTSQIVAYPMLTFGFSGGFHVRVF